MGSASKVTNLLKFLQNGNVVRIRSNEEFNQFGSVMLRHGLTPLLRGWEDHYPKQVSQTAKSNQGGQLLKSGEWDGKTFYAECQIGKESIAIYPYTVRATVEWYGTEPMSVEDIDLSQKEGFKITGEEAALLDRIADATKMDCWFYIDEDLHVHDIEEGTVSSDAEGVCLLEDGLGYGLDEPQSGGLNPKEIQIVEACFKRAREGLLRERISKREGITDCVAMYLDLFEDTDVMHRDVVETTIEELRDGDEENNMEAGRLELMLKDNPGVTYFDYYEEKPIDFEWLCERLEMPAEAPKKPQKAAPKGEKRYYSVPVVYEMYGSISVEAGSAEEAYDQVKEHPEDFDLPDEGFYVDGSLKVADDDRENAIGTIEMLNRIDD